jgi:DNA-binding NarL/FixJ family response regulator
LAPEPATPPEPDPPLVLAIEDLAVIIRAALGLGAAGYLLPDADDIELIAAVHTVAAIGQPAQPRPMTGRIGDPPALSERDQTALRLWASGHTNPQVAHALDVSLRTVTTIRATLRDRLALTDRAQIAAYVQTHLR